MPRAAAHHPAPLFALPGERIDTVINWGLGVDSTAYLAEMLNDPAAHGIDLARTAVIHMATGSEWPLTHELAETFILPLLRQHNVRLVQLVRTGKEKAAGITVLDDSRQPLRLIRRGEWTLWDEYESNGTVPQQAGPRKCSLRAKGDVGDRWAPSAIDGPFRQLMGYNADEAGRALKDRRDGNTELRTGVYPLIEWGWGRQRCEDYLLDRFGVEWPKSYCTFCCYPVSMGSLPGHLDRMRRHPDIAGQVLRLEYTSVSLNPNARLFGKESLLQQFDPSRPADRPVLEAFERELACPWALYHVRRILPASKKDPSKRGPALRSVERVDLGRPDQLGRRLTAISERHRVPVETDPRYGRTRAWLRTRGTAFPITEELFTTAPHHVRDKQEERFEKEWAAATGGTTPTLPSA